MILYAHQLCIAKIVITFGNNNITRARLYNEIYSINTFSFSIVYKKKFNKKPRILFQRQSKIIYKL